MATSNQENIEKNKVQAGTTEQNTSFRKNPTIKKYMPYLLVVLILAIAYSMGGCIVKNYKFVIGKEYYDEGDYEEAIEYFSEAVERGDVMAQYYLAECYLKTDDDILEAIDLCRKAANKGIPEAQFLLGKCYDEDLVGKWQYNDAKAMKWYRKAAKQGFPEAQYKLAVHYETGAGVALNFQKALKYYREAARLGHKEALFRLGQCYYDGEGVEKNLKEAVEWWTKAAEKGHAEAKQALSKCQVQ